MELQLQGKHIFSLIRLVSKLNIKADCLNLYKTYSKLVNRKSNMTIKLKLALGDKENNDENMANLLEENEVLKNELADVQGSQRELVMDIVFLVIDKIAVGEKEVLTLLADLYGVKTKDIEQLKPQELIKAIKDVIMNEEMQQAFLSIFK